MTLSRMIISALATLPFALLGCTDPVAPPGAGRGASLSIAANIFEGDYDIYPLGATDGAGGVQLLASTSATGPVDCPILLPVQKMPATLLLSNEPWLTVGVTGTLTIIYGEYGTGYGRYVFPSGFHPALDPADKRRASIETGSARCLQFQDPITGLFITNVEFFSYEGVRIARPKPGTDGGSGGDGGWEEEGGGDEEDGGWLICDRVIYTNGKGYEFEVLTNCEPYNGG